MYVVAGVGNFSIPAFFTSGPGGVNGIAEDDIVTGVVGLGALVVLFGLLANSRSRGEDGKPLFRDPVCLSIVSAWVMIYLVMPVTGEGRAGGGFGIVSPLTSLRLF